MKSYREEKQGVYTILWDDATGIGLRFKVGERMQYYSSETILPDFSSTSTEEGIENVTRVTNELRDYAAEKYPEEFKQLKEPTY